MGLDLEAIDSDDGVQT